MTKSATNQPNRIVICTDRKWCDNLDLLDKSRFIVHNDPHIEYSTEAGLLANFDFYLDISLSKLKDDHTELLKLNGRYIDGRRFQKTTQAVTANLFGLGVPPTVVLPFGNDSLRTTRNDIVSMVETLNLKDDDDVVLKAENGARGVGQLFCKYKDLRDVLKKYWIDGVKIDPKDKKITLGGAEDDHEKEKYERFLFGSAMHISKKLTLQREYRIVFNSAGDKLYSLRKKNNQRGWQANGVGDIVDASHIPTEVRNKLSEFIEHIGFPFGSIDLYLDDDNNWGIFEYQMQFGFDTFPVGDIKKLVNVGMMDTVNKRLAK